MSSRVSPTVVVSMDTMTPINNHIASDGSSHSLVKDGFVKTVTVPGIVLNSASGVQDLGALSGSAAKKFHMEQLIFEVTSGDFPAFLVCGAATAFGVTWTGVADGAFNVTADGVGPIDIVGCNFAACTNMGDVAAVVQTQLRVSVPLALVVWDTDHFKITSGSDVVGVSDVAVLAAPAAGTDISGAGATAFLAGTVATGAVKHALPDGAATFNLGSTAGGSDLLSGETCSSSLCKVGHTRVFTPGKNVVNSILGSSHLYLDVTAGDGASLNLVVKATVLGTES